jgi:hypothetical protein
MLAILICELEAGHVVCTGISISRDSENELPEAEIPGASERDVAVAASFSPRDLCTSRIRQ